MVPAPSHWVSRVPWYSGFPPPCFRLRLRGFHPLRPPFPGAFGWLLHSFCGSLPRHAAHDGLGSFPFARRYSGNRSFFLFLRLLRCFSSPGSPPCTIIPFGIVHAWMHEGSSCGFPHSDTHGSSDICSSPWLFAAYRVFLRLSVPRHPPCALSCLASLLHSVAEGGSFFSFSSAPSFWCGLGCLSYLF